MSPAADETPKMTAAEADARFAALVAEHRGGKKSGTSRDTLGKADDRMAALGAALVYCLGVAAGAFWHAKPLIAVLVGAPLVFFARVLVKRPRGRVDAS